MIHLSGKTNLSFDTLVSIKNCSSSEDWKKLLMNWFNNNEANAFTFYLDNLIKKKETDIQESDGAGSIVIYT